MEEAYFSADSNMCDGINYWELAQNFSWETDYRMSSYTRNFAAMIIQRAYRSYKVCAITLKKIISNKYQKG